MQPKLPGWTWIAPLAIGQAGLLLSLPSQTAPGAALWYLPIPLGMALIHWWGWRVLPALYLNAVISVAFWGTHTPWLAPVYALPEAGTVALSYALFRRKDRTNPQLSHIDQALRFVGLGLILPVLAGTLSLQGLQAVFTGLGSWAHFLHAASEGFIRLLFISFTVVPLLLITCTPWLARRGLLLDGKPATLSSPGLAPSSKWESWAAFVCIPTFIALAPIAYFSYLAGLVALWTIVRMNRITALRLNGWMVFITCLLFLLRPAWRPLGSDLATAASDMALTFILTSVASLIGGTTLDDLRREVALRQIALRALRESQTRFKEIAHQIDDVIFLVHRSDGSPVYLNPATARLLGETPENLLGKPGWLTDRLAPGQEALREQLAAPGFWDEPKVRELQVDVAGRENRWLRLRIHPATETGELSRVPGLLTDITEAKAAERREADRRLQMQQTDKLASLGLLVAGVAHEINNPNALILLGAEALQNQLPDAGTPAERQRLMPWVQAVTEGSERITRIVSALKDFARVDTRPIKETFGIERLFNSALIIVGHLLRTKTERFELRVAPELPPLTGHFQKLEQVLINLLHNACQALEHPRQAISLTAERRSTHEIALQVRDEGKGIAPEDLSRVYEPFFTTKRDQGGTGLGLSVVFGIVQEHGGQMLIESALGQGTTVTLLLPILTASNNDIPLP